MKVCQPCKHFYTHDAQCCATCGGILASSSVLASRWQRTILIVGVVVMILWLFSPMLAVASLVFCLIGVSTIYPRLGLVVLGIGGIVMLFIHPMLTLLALILCAIVWHGYYTRVRL